MVGDGLPEAVRASLMRDAERKAGLENAAASGQRSPAMKVVRFLVGAALVLAVAALWVVSARW